MWKTKDAALESRLRATWDGLAAAQQRKLPIQVAISGGIGQPLVLRLTDPNGNTAGQRSAGCVTHICCVCCVPRGAEWRRRWAAASVVVRLAHDSGIRTGDWLALFLRSATGIAQLAAS